MTRTRLVLTPKLKFELMTLVQARFTEKQLNDREFAKFANIELMSDDINDAHVYGCRKALDIPAAAVSAASAPRWTLVLERLTVLENEVSSQAKELARLREECKHARSLR